MSNVDRERDFLRKLASQRATEARQSIGLGALRFEVIAAFGQPAAAETKQMKSKHLETLKYGQKGRSFALKVFLENGRVIGWEEKP